jgi:predicted TIM-barrel fold metal-dependent hydrolase
LGRNVVVPDGTVGMENIPARIRHMDELGVDVQVLHATIFINQVADREDAEIAVCRGWNRWVADIWKQGNGRLLWSCVLPLKSMDAALEELRFCKQNGAVAVFLRCIEGNRLLHDPYFYPLYEAASELDMAMVVHVGNANELTCDLLSQYNAGGGFWSLRANMAGACHALIASGMMRDFPRLKYSFLEASSQWVPFVVNDLRKRMGSRGRGVGENPLKENRIYVACETSDDLPFVLKYAGEDNLVIGTDYGHTDQSSEIEAIQNLKKMGEIDSTVLNKMIDDNPRALYSL